MEKIVECVINFSEGRDEEKIAAIAEVIRETEGAALFDIDTDPDYNRTVMTFMGAPEPVAEAAFRATKAAMELIDMTKYTGEHPCIGATDVVPFVSLRNTTMDECVEISKKYAKRVGAELNIPVYLYGASADRSLPKIRKGGFHGLAEKLQTEKPDFGPDEPHPTAGATVAGARDILIAYNIDLDGADREKANEIAGKIRESAPDGLPGVRAIGVYLKERDIAQVSVNILDYENTGLHDVFERCKKEAEALGVSVSGSELIGLVPLKALTDAGKFYAPDEEKEMLVVWKALSELGLSTDFRPEERVIEYILD